MNEFSYRPGSEALEFQSFGLQDEVSHGVYIPQARECMSCGLCLNSCPTYQVMREESYSPRGRLRLIERVIEKGESLDQAELQALDACTLCRACEKVCPSKMAYSQLYLQAMEGLTQPPRRPFAIRLVFRLVEQSLSRPRLLNGFIRFYQRSGIQRLLRRLSLFSRYEGLGELDRLLPVRHETDHIPAFTPADSDTSRGKLGLFTGCIANLLDSQNHNATIQLLTRLGYDVSVVTQRACCGATYAHNGEIERARACARQNISAFTAGGLDAVVYNSSGCGAFLGEYANLLDGESVTTRLDEMPPVNDILEFLINEASLDRLGFGVLNAKVAVHESCSQRNVLGNAGMIPTLLAHIPGLEIVPLPGNEMCCGAGGTKMVTHPALAAPARDEKVDALLALDADFLICTNLTCAMHLAAGIRQAGREIVVVHPVQLLAQQML